MARLAPEQRYPTDLTDAQWALVQPHLTTHTGPGAPTTVDLRQMVNGILYLTRTGCQWRMLPRDYGYWGTVRYYYDKWTADGTWVRINDLLRERARQGAGRNPQPSAAILDSQSVKMGHVAGERGFDAAKKVTGRKRHVLVDTLGFLLRAFVTPGDVSDGAGGMGLLLGLSLLFIRLRLLWVDQGYKEGFVAWVAEHVGWTVEIVKGLAGQHGFVVQPKRWIVERSIDWYTRPRRLSKDYEYWEENSASYLYIASIHVLLQRLAPAH